MIRLELDHTEKEILKGILEAELSDLRMEIANTDLLAYRDRLRESKRVLHKVLDAIDPDRLISSVA